MSGQALLRWDEPPLVQRAQRIRDLVGTTRTCIVEIGRELITASEVVEKDKWGRWLKDEFDWSIRTAQNYIAVANSFGSARVASDFDHLTIDATVAAMSPPHRVHPGQGRVTEGWAILAGEATVFGGIGGIVLLIGKADRIAVSLLRRSGLPIYPLAVSIALLLYEHPEQWTGGALRLSHPKVGSIWTAGGVSDTKIVSDWGEWCPGWIERRIVRDAVDWRLRAYVQNRIAQAMRALPS